MKPRANLIILGGMVIGYFAASLTPFGVLFFGPIEILVTFFHEFGHAFFGILTGGKVASLQVSPDGAGLTQIYGGAPWLYTMGGYIGSCIFSNILVRISLTDKVFWTWNILAGILIFSAFYWYSDAVTVGLLISCAVSFLIFSRFPSISSLLMQFIGISCVIHVLQDFRVGPSSDLASFEETVGIFPAWVWMYIWLAISLFFTYLNVKQILTIKSSRDGLHRKNS